MALKNEAWLMRKIFSLSDRAFIRMVNHIFGKEYSDEESVWKEWQADQGVGLRIGGVNRYEFRIRMIEGSLQISAEDKGCAFYYEKAVLHQGVQLGESALSGFGEGRQEEYRKNWEFSAREQIVLPTHLITLEACPARRLEEKGVIVFLPFLFYCFVRQPEEEEIRREALKYFLIHDIVGALGESYRKGNLTAFDVVRLKKLCRQMAWKTLGREDWMQELDTQELILDTLEPDVDFLERVCHGRLPEIQNK